jgi:hypothetical protein
MKTFEILWFKNEKYGFNPIERKIMIQSADAQSALQVFMRINGNLKTNTVIYIQELDKDGNPIGEPIVPSEESEPIELTKAE